MAEKAALAPVRRIAGLLARGVTAITGPWTRKNAVTWELIIGAVLVFRWLVFEPYSIPSGSMEPTLHGDPRFFRGDRIWTNKLIYGPRVPFMNKRLFHIAEPKRWDIIVFNTVQEQAAHPTLIKRVVGLPGERIHIADGKIWVNGAPVEPPEALRNTLHYTTELDQRDSDLRTFILQMAKANVQSAFLNPANWTARDFNMQVSRIRERLGDRDPAQLTEEQVQELMRELNPLSLKIGKELFGMHQAAQYPFRYGILEDDAYCLVPDNCYLVCGDNSGDSVDGRFFGWLPNGNIMGRASCIWWPIGRLRDFTGFSKTWWGMGLLYGVPASAVLLECLSWMRRRKRQGRQAAR